MGSATMKPLPDDVRVAIASGDGVAWISPSGGVLPGTGEDSFPDVPGGEATVHAGLAESRKEMLAAREACETLLAANEHPEWHSYEMAAFDHEKEARRAVLNMHAKGWIRLELDGHAGSPRRLQASGASDRLDLLDGELETTCSASGWVLRPEPADPGKMARIRQMADPPGGLAPPRADGRFESADAEGRWVDAAGALSRQGFGWLAPDGRLLTCDLHGHLEIAALTGARPGDFLAVEAAANRMRNTKRNLRRIEEGGADARRRLTALSAAREADADLSRAKAALVGDLYADGWIRLGLRGEPGTRTLGAEGTGSFIARRRPTLEALADWSEAKLSVSGPGVATAPTPGLATRRPATFGSPFGRR